MDKLGGPEVRNLGEFWDSVSYQKKCCENDAKWKTLYDVHQNNKAKEMTGITSNPMFVYHPFIKKY